MNKNLKQQFSKIYIEKKNLTQLTSTKFGFFTTKFNNGTNKNPEARSE